MWYSRSKYVQPNLYLVMLEFSCVIGFRILSETFNFEHLGSVYTLYSLLKLIGNNLCWNLNQLCTKVRIGSQNLYNFCMITLQNIFFTSLPLRVAKIQTWAQINISWWHEILPHEIFPLSFSPTLHWRKNFSINPTCNRNMQWDKKMYHGGFF